MARFFVGLFRRVAGPRRPALPPLIAPGHRFDQTNGTIIEREPTVAELVNARWSDHEPPPTVMQWGWRVVDPARSPAGREQHGRRIGAAAESAR